MTPAWGLPSKSAPNGPLGGEAPVDDVIYLALVAGFFLLMALLSQGLKKL